MQTALKFSEANFDNILQGKRYTIRKGLREVHVGEIPLIADHTERMTIASVFHVSLQPFESLMGDYSKDGLMEHYPDLLDTDIVTLIKFKI